MSLKEKILVIEDDGGIAKFLKATLNANGYDVIIANTGSSAISLISSNRPDVILLDLGLPDMDGTHIIEEVRKWTKTPIIVISARSTEADKANALDLGADDYMAKPFSPKELGLRVAAILRRSQAPEHSTHQELVSGQIRIDLTARRVFVDDIQINLTPKEFDLLTLLVGHPNVAFSRKRLLDLVWGGELSGGTRTLDTHIKQVRHAIAPYSDRIITLRGVGYRFE